jgi:REP element-mobilizing transposase RayT
MPRQARIDAPIALHHVVIRGIEQKKIFEDDKDREDFLERLSGILQEKVTPCYAWALMSNHVHLLLRTGTAPIASIMRRVLTGYAVRFNKRHRRHGHLFQNRYKSILCKEDRYLLQLVAYIHLNPVRAGIVEDVAALKGFAFAGHSVLMGEISRPWQDTEYVLALLGKTRLEARRNLVRHVSEWWANGRCSEFTGGGLIRSAGEAFDRRMQLRSAGVDLSSVIAAVCRNFSIDEKDLVSASKRLNVAHARAVVSHIATRGLSISGSDVARQLNLDRSAVSRGVYKVENNPDLTEAARTVLGLLGYKASQH